MKKFVEINLLVIFVLVVVLFSAIYTYQKFHKNTLTVTPTPYVLSLTFCDPRQLKAVIELSPGAGNVYGTFTLKNISPISCEVLGDRFIEVQFDKAIKNITITHIGVTQKESFILHAGQTLYSQVHYPNGPQCQSVGLVAVPVTFHYQISPKNQMTFVTEDVHMQQVVQACTSLKDITDIQVWNMAVQPITPLTLSE